MVGCRQRCVTTGGLLRGARNDGEGASVAVWRGGLEVGRLLRGAGDDGDGGTVKEVGALRCASYTLRLLGLGLGLGRCYVRHVRRLARPDVMPRIPRGLHAGYAGW